MSLTKNLCKNIQAKLVTEMAALDYSKAFDTLSHQILLNRLSTIGLSAQSRFQSYLEDTRLRVKYNGALADCALAPCGVPQESSFNPTRFIIHVKDLLLKLRDSTALAYADYEL